MFLGVPGTCLKSIRCGVCTEELRGGGGTDSKRSGLPEELLEPPCCKSEALGGMLPALPRIWSACGVSTFSTLTTTGSRIRCLGVVAAPRLGAAGEADAALTEEVPFCGVAKSSGRTAEEA
mmetsp:Transcript_93418/g.166211  ORF Transcript_93418/g.166211 Transcript_93418/m.166211 type:complete len:121 (+) Transcript_93418:525-887(+)